jgi:hypothetical protein
LVSVQGSRPSNAGPRTRGHASDGPASETLHISSCRR